MIEPPYILFVTAAIYSIRFKYLHCPGCTSLATANQLVSEGSCGELVGHHNAKMTGPTYTRSLHMNRVKTQKRQMVKIKGVMLLPLHAQSYCSHMANHTFLARVNSGAKTPDPRLELTQLVEERIRQELNLLLSSTNLRVLRWEEIDQRNRLVVRFRELDGFFKTDNGVTVLIEVKASASKGSLKTGLEQLQSSLKIATHVHPNTIGLLVVADLGEWYDMFGQAASQPLAKYFSGMDLDLIDWPPYLPACKTSGICVSLIPGSLLGEWLPSESEGDFE